MISAECKVIYRNSALCQSLETVTKGQHPCWRERDITVIICQSLQTYNEELVMTPFQCPATTPHCGFYKLFCIVVDFGCYVVHKFLLLKVCANFQNNNLLALEFGI
jgi:hypothetical protein